MCVDGAVAICEVERIDGILFDGESVEGTRIKEKDEYEGVRVKFHAVRGRRAYRCRPILDLAPPLCFAWIGADHGASIGRSTGNEANSGSG